VSLLAHGGAGIINTWGFAYVGGIIGLFSLSLLYVKATLEQRNDPSRPNSLTAAIVSIGPAVIVIGGVCGVSLGLGIGGLLDDAFGDDADVSAVLTELCDLRTSGPGPLASGLHDDVAHAIDDLDIVSAEPAHRALHDDAVAPDTTTQDWAESVDQLAAGLAAADASTTWTCASETPTS
jgi:hypothetical protein